MLLHEAAKTREVGGDTGDPHHCALSWWRTEHLSGDRWTHGHLTDGWLTGYQECIPMAHNRRGTLQGYNHEQNLHSPWAAEDWWRTGTQDGK